MGQWRRPWLWCGDHDDQVLGLRKEKREKQKTQGKGEIDMSFFGLVIDTLSECDHI